MCIFLQAWAFCPVSPPFISDSLPIGITPFVAKKKALLFPERLSLN